MASCARDVAGAAGDAVTGRSGDPVAALYNNISFDILFAAIPIGTRGMTATTTPDLAKMRGATGEIVRMLRTLGNQDRLILLCELARGERCVGELEENLAIRQPTLSQQLGVLRSEGMVAGRREGKHIYYTVADPQALQLLRSLERLFCGPSATPSHSLLSKTRGPRK
jgi:DNA-binding transcriptional ArsR family regulator